MDKELADALGVTRGCAVALDAMEQYGANARCDVDFSEQDFCALPVHQRRLAPGFLPRIDRVRTCISDNAKVLDAVLACHRDALRVRFPPSQKKRSRRSSEEEEEEEDCCPKNAHPEHVRGMRASAEHQEMAKNLFMQFYREWSREGAAERAECYRPAVEMAVRHAPPTAAPAPAEDEQQQRKLAFVPGAGFCRMAYDLVQAGYAVEACEPSHAMLLPAQYVLSGHSGMVWPFAHVTANIASAAEMSFSQAHFPDQPVDLALVRARLRVTGGDFVSIARRAPRGGLADVLVTCFFVDTAFNVLDYIEAASCVLKPGGVWVNVGPLHWVHSPSESLRLSIEEIEGAMERVGFEFLERGRLPLRHYCSPPSSLMPMVFDCATWVARMPH